MIHTINLKNASGALYVIDTQIFNNFKKFYGSFLHEKLWEMVSGD